MKTKNLTSGSIKHPVFLLPIIFLVLASLYGCQQQGSQITFGDGNIPGDVPLPIYPGAIQSTESMALTVPDDLTPGVPITEWRRFITTDTPDQVLAWYAQALPDAGFSYKGTRPSGSVFFITGNWRYGMIVKSEEGKTNIIIAAGHE